MLESLNPLFKAAAEKEIKSFFESLIGADANNIIIRRKINRFALRHFNDLNHPSPERCIEAIYQWMSRQGQEQNGSPLSVGISAPPLSVSTFPTTAPVISQFTEYCSNTQNSYNNTNTYKSVSSPSEDKMEVEYPQDNHNSRNNDSSDHDYMEVEYSEDYMRFG